MKVSVTITAAKAGGKSHLAAAIRRWLTEEYPAVTTLDVTIIERYTPESEEDLLRSTTFIVIP